MSHLWLRRAIWPSRRSRWHSWVCVTSDRSPRAPIGTASRVERRCDLVVCIQCTVELLLKFEYLKAETFRLRFWLIGKCTHRINVRNSPLNEVFQEGYSISSLAHPIRCADRQCTPSLNVSWQGFQKLLCRCPERLPDPYSPYLLGLALIQCNRNQYWEVC